MTTEARTAHTPGPWETTHNMGDIWIRTAPASPVDCLMVAEVVLDENDPQTGEEYDANGRLIAAAPEMYEALRDIASHPDTSKVATRWARAALAKAEGRE